MKILIVYATSEGHTRKIAGHLSDLFQARDHEVTLNDSASSLGDLDLISFDAILLAGSVHNTTHQDSLVNFALAQRKKLGELPSALVSVSLSAAMKDGDKDARAYVDRFIEETGWRPDETHLAAGAIRYSEYDYFRQQIIKSIMSERGVDTDPEADHVFTDWRALDRFASAFIERAGAS